VEGDRATLLLQAYTCLTLAIAYCKILSYVASKPDPAPHYYLRFNPLMFTLFIIFRNFCSDPYRVVQWHCAKRAEAHF